MKTVLIESIPRLLFLPIWMVALGLMIKGYGGVGDGFSAGVLASLALIIRLLAEERPPDTWSGSLRWGVALLSGGLITVLSVAFFPVLVGSDPLTHFPGPDQSVTHLGKLELHTAILLDLGIFLLVLGSVMTMVRALRFASERRER